MQQQRFHDIVVQKIVFKGMGLATLSSGKKVLIKGNVLPNSIVDVAVIQKKKDFFIAELVTTKSYNKNDIALENITCPHYVSPLQMEPKGCGGCKRQIIPYPKQLEIKESIVFDSFRSYPKLLDNTHIGTIIAAPEPFYYRNKVEFSFGLDDKGKNALGFHETGSFQSINDIESCSLISKNANDIFQTIKQKIKDIGIASYNQKKHTGTLRHLVIREGTNTGQCLVNIVYADKNRGEEEQNQWNELLQILKKNEQLQKKVTTAVTTLNNSLGEAIPYDNKNLLVRGEGHIYEELQVSNHSINDDNQQTTLVIEQGTAKEVYTTKSQTNKIESSKIICKISPTSFFQTNTKAAESLLKTVAQCVPQNNKILLDLYCGTGSIGLSLLKIGKTNHVIGIEVMQGAIDDAKHNAYINKLEDKVYFTAGKAEELLYKDEHIRSVRENIKTIIVDPPRAGLHKKVISFLSGLKVSTDYTLIYISCNPVTLARDLQEFHKQGFKITNLQTLDMFPQTYHVETITILK